jgi:hypothetical protein
MSDDRVLERVEVLVARSNQLTAELLAHLAEVERRGLHLREACGSLFAFCVERLHMSEAAAGKRITAARVARRFPIVLGMVARGEIHLTGVNLLAAHLSEENHAELLERARHRSKREIEKLMAEIAPRADAKSRVVALPRRLMARVAEERAPERVDGEERAPERADGDERAPERAETVGRGPAAVVEPLAPRRYQIRVTVGEEAHSALVQLQDLLSHQLPDRDPAAIIELSLELLLERTLARKAAVTGRPRERKAPARRTRHIPAAGRREVWKRDGGRCAYVDAKGRRCSSTRFLEYHHLHNWARGADHEPDEIELRCRAHNQYQAVLDYGDELIARRRRAPSRAGERRARYGPSPAGEASAPDRARDASGGPAATCHTDRHAGELVRGSDRGLGMWQRVGAGCAARVDERRRGGEGAAAGGRELPGHDVQRQLRGRGGRGVDPAHRGVRG